MHSFLVHFPVAFLTTSTICDTVSLAGIQAAWNLACLLLSAGVATGLAAMMVGLLDLQKLSPAAAATGQLHMLLISCAWMLYTASLVTRYGNEGSVAAPALLPVALSATGFAFLVVGGWYGAELVYRYGAGSDREPGA